MAAMEEDAGSRKRGLFSDVSQEPAAKVARQSNAEYLVAFQSFDQNSDGIIDLKELRDALQAVQESVDAASDRARRLLFPRPFHIATCCWLCARFGDGSRLTSTQFCDLLAYVRNLKSIFEQVDTNHDGSIECSELHRAFALSGVDLDAAVIAQIGQSFDVDSSGKLEFDEFVQMRLEWDCYVSAWDQATEQGAVIHPEKLFQLLEEIKISMEPIGLTLRQQAELPRLWSQGLFFSSMFKTHRPFQTRTCEMLIIRFGGGNLFLNFSQYSAMLVFIKEMKAAFCKFDTDGSGSLNLEELSNCFTSAGMQLPSELVVQIGRSFDLNQSGDIEFDEFIQMAVEWQEMCQEQARFSARASGKIGADNLQELLGSVRVLYQVRNNVVQSIRPCSTSMCRLLVAMFGTPVPGEARAQSVSWSEFLELCQFLKEAFAKYLECDISRRGTVTTQDLQQALAANGLVLSTETVENIRRNYDVDCSGSLEFDEFIQLLVECKLYNLCFEARVKDPATLTPLNRLSPAFGQVLYPTGCGTPFISLDKAAFFSMVFAVPRHH